jgi:hypothetical protein
VCAPCNCILIQGWRDDFCSRLSMRFQISRGWCNYRQHPEQACLDQGSESCSSHSQHMQHFPGAGLCLDMRSHDLASSATSASQKILISAGCRGQDFAGAAVIHQGRCKCTQAASAKSHSRCIFKSSTPSAAPKNSACSALSKGHSPLSTVSQYITNLPIFPSLHLCTGSWVRAPWILSCCYRCWLICCCCCERST